MKVNIQSLAEIKATKVIPSGDLVLLAKGIAGKKAQVEVEPTMTIADFIKVARTALDIDPAIVFADIIVERAKAPLTSSKSLGENGVANGSLLMLRFKRVV